MQTPTIETKQGLGITEVPGTEFVPVSEPKDVPLNSEIKKVPDVEKVAEVVQENIVDETPITTEIGIGYELGVIGEVTGKGLPSDIAREAIDSKIKNLPLVE